MKRRLLKSFLHGLSNFLLFFAMISFVVTCSFLLFFSTVTLSEEDVRAVAPLVFFNVLVLASLFTLSDLIRRLLTVERPTRAIQRMLDRLMQGDYTARVRLPRNQLNRENRFGDIAISLNLLAEELSSVETLRTDFISNVSHELKTPLAVMQNYGTMLGQPTLPDQTRIEYAKAITAAARRLASLITNILKLSKLENQQIFPSVSQFDLGEHLCQSILNFEDDWERKNLKIDTDLTEEITVRSDPELLSLVWNNLLSNAVKFTPEGGTVSIRMQTEADDQIAVRISDTGCGMPPEVGAHIFEKFYQGDTSHATQGNGLGLALVKRVVDIMHGEIGVESVCGEGTTFTVRMRRNWQ